MIETLLRWAVGGALKETGFTDVVKHPDLNMSPDSYRSFIFAVDHLSFPLRISDNQIMERLS